MAYTDTGTTISVVVPVRNEKENVGVLYQRLSDTLNDLWKIFEVIFVDDGSTDGTYQALEELYREHPYTVRVVRLRKGFGKTPALVAGIAKARGEVIFTMDGDLQDDPSEIKHFLIKLDEGYDVVTGWKYHRLDPITKTFPSRIFNWMVSRGSGLRLHDINCGFKAYRHEVWEDMHIKLYGELHRFIPVLAHWRGFRVAEIPVQHHKREHGRSKYGGRRFARGLFDLLTVLFLTSSSFTPMRLFGTCGFWSFLLGVLVDGFVVGRSYWMGEAIHNQPLLLVGIVLIGLGAQCLLLGLIGSMIRHYGFQTTEEFSVKEELVPREEEVFVTNWK